MKTSIIANQVVHTIVPPQAVLSSLDCACILVNVTSFLPKDKPSVSQMIFHIENLTAPNSLFLEAAIMNSVRDYGLLDTNLKGATEKLLSLGYDSEQANQILEGLTNYVNELFPAQGL